MTRNFAPNVQPQEVVVRDHNNQVFLQRNMVYNHLTVSSVTMRAPAAIAPNSIGVVNVTVVTRRNREGGGPPTQKPISFNLSVRTNAAGQIDACPASGVSEVQTYSCVAPRSSACNIRTPTDKVYDFCAISRFEGNGDDGGNPERDHCRVEKVGPGIWNLQNTRGNDPSRTCEMICVLF